MIAPVVWNAVPPKVEVCVVGENVRIGASPAPRAGVIGIELPALGGVVGVVGAVGVVGVGAPGVSVTNGMRRVKLNPLPSDGTPPASAETEVDMMSRCCRCSAISLRCASSVSSWDRAIRTKTA